MNKITIECQDCSYVFKPPFDDEEIANHRKMHEPEGLRIRIENRCPHCGKEIED